MDLKDILVEELAEMIVQLPFFDGLVSSGIVSEQELEELVLQIIRLLEEPVEEAVEGIFEKIKNFFKKLFGGNKNEK